jgi:hypothetical protein
MDEDDVLDILRPHLAYGGGYELHLETGLACYHHFRLLPSDRLPLYCQPALCAAPGSGVTHDYGELEARQQLVIVAMLLLASTTVRHAHGSGPLPLCIDIDHFPRVTVHREPVDWRRYFVAEELAIYDADPGQFMLAAVVSPRRARGLFYICSAEALNATMCAYFSVDVKRYESDESQ